MHTHTESYSSRKRPEFVVLDIGEGIGALILHTDDVMHGVEIEISPSGDDAHRSHKEVLERNCGGTPAFTAVFDAMPAGSYTLWLNDSPIARGVGIEGGRVAQMDLRGALHAQEAV